MTVLTRIPDDSLIVVCDSRKALFLTNVGTPVLPVLRTEDHIAAPATAAEDSDRPGRRFDGGAAAGGFHARSAMEVPDIEKEHAQEFAELVAGRLAEKYRGGDFRHLIVAAPPEFLGLVRGALKPQVAGTIVAEVGKRLTEFPVDDIAEHIVEGW